MVSTPPLKHHVENGFRQIAALFLLLITACATVDREIESPDPLSLWQDNATKAGIQAFIEQINLNGVPVEDRIATFDFDGTIGVEKPTYTEVVVSSNKMCEIAKKDPSLRDKQPYKAACEQDWPLINASASYTYEILLKSFLDQPVTEYLLYAENFIESELEPRFQLPYDELIYAPMRQLIEYLQSQEFKVYLVSGSQTFFLRAMVQSAGLPISSGATIGSTIDFSYSTTAEAWVEFLRKDHYKSPMADGAGKAELIMENVGKMPLFAAGNTMGDFEMLYSASHQSLINMSDKLYSSGFSMIINHDDPVREYEYTDQMLMENAGRYNWTIVSMKNDFTVVFDE